MQRLYGAAGGFPGGSGGPGGFPGGGSSGGAPGGLTRKEDSEQRRRGLDGIYVENMKLN